jgi:hypothetical protein
MSLSIFQAHNKERKKTNITFFIYQKAKLASEGKVTKKKAQFFIKA